MLAPETQQMIQQDTAQLPDYAQAAMASFDWQQELRSIAAKHGLNENQADRLITETFLVILGAEDPTLFINALMNHMGVIESVARAIAEEVDERLMQRMQKFILTNYQEEIENLQDAYTLADENVMRAEYEEALYQKAEEEGVDLEALQQTGIEISEEPPVLGEQMTVPQPSLAAQKMKKVFKIEDVKSDHSLDMAGYSETDPYHEPIE